MRGEPEDSFSEALLGGDRGKVSGGGGGGGGNGGGNGGGGGGHRGSVGGGSGGKVEEIVQVVKPPVYCLCHACLRAERAALVKANGKSAWVKVQTPPSWGVRADVLGASQDGVCVAVLLPGWEEGPMSRAPPLFSVSSWYVLLPFL